MLFTLPSRDNKPINVCCLRFLPRCQRERERAENADITVREAWRALLSSTRNGVAPSGENVLAPTRQWRAKIVCAFASSSRIYAFGADSMAQCSAVRVPAVNTTRTIFVLPAISIVQRRREGGEGAKEAVWASAPSMPNFTNILFQ